jgi:outer membrane protein
MKYGAAAIFVAMTLSMPSLARSPARAPGPVAASPAARGQGAIPRICKGRVRQGCRSATWISQNWKLPPFELESEPQPTETLAEALDDAYRDAPALQAQRYQLRATDEDYAQALAELRPTTVLEVTGGYSKTVPGRVTQASRPPGSSPTITSNSVGAKVTLTQPLYTGGRVAANRDAALAAISAGRAQLRGVEGDLLLQVITAYSDICRDRETLRLRGASLRQLQATLDEVVARREAGELTLTDIAQAETQKANAEAQLNAARQQLEQDRATFAALVGRDPGVLAPPPRLPGVPQSIEQAFAIADKTNPDLQQAIAAERASRARIASAAAQAKPNLTLRGTAELSGQAIPYHLYNQDQQFAGQAVLTIPLTNGGRVGSLVAQAQDRNAVDRIGIESARRQMVAGIVNSWNSLATAQRNIVVGEAGLASARVLNEGMFEEYRAGLRSTFDVLFAQGALRDAQLALVNARSELYLAEANLLRRLGRLEVASLMRGTGLYDPAANFADSAKRARTPWDGMVRRGDRRGRAKPKQQGLETPPLSGDQPVLAPTDEAPLAVPVLTSPNVPLPGTTGTPLPDKSLKRP